MCARVPVVIIDLTGRVVGTSARRTVADCVDMLLCVNAFEFAERKLNVDKVRTCEI